MFQQKLRVWTPEIQQAHNEQRMAGGGDPRKRAMYPKMPTQAIIESEGFDPDVPSDLSRAYARRMADKAEYERNIKDQKLTPAQRGVAGLEAAGMLGSAMFEGVQQLPKLLDSQEAYESAVGQGMYRPRFQPEKAVEYAGNVGDFLEQLETKYKMPQVLPELLGFAPLAEAAKRQAGKAVKQGAMTAASRMEAGPKAGSMAAQRGAVKLGGGNWVDSEIKRGLKRQTYPESYIESRKKDLIENNLNLTPDAIAQGEILKRNIADMEQANAFNKWVETKIGSYVRNQMSTPDDPVVKMLDVRSAKIEADYQAGQKRLAKLDERIAQAPSSTQEERNTIANLKRTRAQRAADIENDRELAINSLLPEGRDYSGYDYLKDNADDLIDVRKKTGFPIEGYGQSKPAKAWEAAQDLIIGMKPAKNYQGSAEKLAAVKDAEKAYKQYMEVELPQKFKEFINNTNLPKSEKQTIIKKTPIHHMKEIIGGDEKYDQITDDLRKARNNANAGNIAYEKDNPYLAKLSPDTTVYDASYMPDLGIDHIIDVLRDDIASGKLKLEDLNKITMDQAVKRAGEYDFEMAKKARDSVAQSRATMPVHKEYPEGYKWVQLTEPGDFNAESNAMGHSVRGYEPEKGHPDWKPESGDSGYSDYGHGGWEAIKSGEAKVYSLVDPSGNPHTTIEVKGNPNPYPVSGEAFTMLPSKTKAEYGQYVREWRQRNPDIEELTDENVTQALKEAGVKPQPDIITQIKGKGNARPQEKYDKYTQDFVRSGNWSDVNELKNTGLYPVSKDYLGHLSNYTPAAPDVQHLKKQQRMEALAKAIDAGDLPEKGYVTRDEWEEALRKHGRPTYGEDTDELLKQLQPPEEGMKAGGRVNRKHFHEQHFVLGGKAISKAASMGAKAAKPAAKVVARDIELNIPQKGSKLVQIPVNMIEHGESVMPGGKMTWPGAKEKIVDYATRKTPLPPIDVVSNESGTPWMVADGSHRLEAAKLRGEKTISAYVSPHDKEGLEIASKLENPTEKAAEMVSAPAVIPNLLKKSTASEIGREERARRQAAGAAEEARVAAAKQMPMPIGYVTHTEKSPNPHVGYRYEADQPVGITPSPTIDVGALERSHKGASILALPWDATNRNVRVSAVSGEDLAHPIWSHGGIPYSSDEEHLLENIGGASGRLIANRIVGREENARKENKLLGGTGEILHAVNTMGKGGENYALPSSEFAFDVINRRVNNGDLTLKQADDLSNEIRNYVDPDTKKQPFKNWAGFISRDGAAQMYTGEGLNGPTGDLRKLIAKNIIYKKKNQELLNFNAEDFVNSITHDPLKGVGRGYIGSNLLSNVETSPMKLSKTADFPWLNPYDTNFSATHLGQLEDLVPIQAVMSRKINPIEQEFLAKQAAKVNGKPYTPESLQGSAISALEKRKDNVAQFMDDRFFQDLSDYMEALKKPLEKKKGGLAQAKKPKKVARHGNTVSN